MITQVLKFKNSIVHIKRILGQIYKVSLFLNDIRYKSLNYYCVTIGFVELCFSGCFYPFSYFILAQNRENNEQTVQHNPAIRIFRPNEGQQNVNNLNYKENPQIENIKNAQNTLTHNQQSFTNVNLPVKQQSVHLQPTTTVSKPRPVQNLNNLTPFQQFSTQATPNPRLVQRNAPQFEQGQSRVQSSPIEFSVPPPLLSSIVNPANNMGLFLQNSYPLN